jgi:hypothetical protein
MTPIGTALHHTTIMRMNEQPNVIVLFLKQNRDFVCFLKKDEELTDVRVSDRFVERLDGLEQDPF